MRPGLSAATSAIAGPATIHRMRRYWLRILLTAILALAVAIPLTILALRRPDVTDPQTISQMPLRELRDREVETLVRAAFQRAESVELSTGVKTPSGEYRPHVIVNDRETLDGLADCFTVGNADGYASVFAALPYPHPGMEYTTVKFRGPYRPDFTFVDQTRISVFHGTHVDVATRFAQKLALPLGLDDVAVKDGPTQNQPGAD